MGDRRLPLDNEYAREPDDRVLVQPAFASHPVDPSKFNFAHLHTRLHEILLRMGEKEADKFGRFVDMLTALEPDEIERIYKLVKLFGFARWLYGGIKWMILSFIAGIGIAAGLGDQISKLAGHIISGWRLWKGQ